MGFFGTLFWILVLWFLIRAWRHSHRCIPVGPRGYWSGWYDRDRYEQRDMSRARTGSDSRQDHVDSLESRISELEERLDFTERLLAGIGEG